MTFILRLTEILQHISKTSVSLSWSIHEITHPENIKTLKWSSISGHHAHSRQTAIHLLPSRLYCRPRNLTGSCLSARGLYRR